MTFKRINDTVENGGHPAPDPILLTAKAACVFLKRHGVEAMAAGRMAMMLHWNNSLKRNKKPCDPQTIGMTLLEQWGSWVLRSLGTGVSRVKEMDPFKFMFVIFAYRVSVSVR